MTLAAFALAASVAWQSAGSSGAELSPGAVVLLANTSDPTASDTLRLALSHGNPLVRRAAARVIAVAHPEAFEALRHALETERDPIVVAEFVKDIMAVAGAKALPIVDSAAKEAGAPAIVEIADWYARMDAQEFASRLAGWAEIPRTQDGLLRAIRLAIAVHPDARDSILKAWSSVANESARKKAQRKISKNEGESVVQTPSPLAARLMQATLAAAGCRSGGSVLGAVVAFAPDGRPKSIDVQRPDLGEPCRAFVVAIARISTADSGDPVRHPHQLVIPLLANFFECAATSAETPLFVADKDEGIREPRLTREVKPNYTREAAQSKLEGHVELEAIVSAEGCVTSTRVTRSLGILDVQGIVAALQWEFEPARLADRPIAGYVGIDLTFTLK